MTGSAAFLAALRTEASLVTGRSIGTVKNAERRCSFCGKAEADVRRLVAGGDPRGVYICNECARLLSEDADLIR